MAVSIYGATAETDDRLTGVPGSFALAVHTLRRLRRVGVNCRVSNVLTRGNFGEFRSVLTLARELGCEYLAEPTIRARANGDTRVIADYRTTLQQLGDFYSDPEVAGGCLEGRLADGRHEVAARRSGNCSAGVTAAFVEATGDVRACIGFGRVFGNVLGAAFDDVWRSRVAELHRAEMRQPVRRCEDCRLVSFCTQRCPQNAAVEDGDPYGPSARACAVARLLYDMRHGPRKGRDTEFTDANPKE